MKKFSIAMSLLLVTSSVAFNPMANAAVRPVDRIGKPALSACPTVVPRDTIYHFDKVIFQLGNGNLIPIIAADFGPLNAIPRLTDLDIKIIDDPLTVAELKGKVLSFLGAQPNSPANRQLLRITDVEYATVLCPKTP